MITEQWQFSLLAGVLVIHLLAIGLMYRYRNDTSRTGGSASDSEHDLIDREAGVLECPNCAAENELGYRYCRCCVSELPGSVAFDGAGNTPLGRLVR
ncbi:MAG: zinc ribbon domain-containing protein [Halobacteriales archaeon]